MSWWRAGWGKWGFALYSLTQAGQVGVFGYTGYAASKFALRGFAESLQVVPCASLCCVPRALLSPDGGHWGGTCRWNSSPGECACALLFPPTLTRLVRCAAGCVAWCLTGLRL